MHTFKILTRHLLLGLSLIVLTPLYGMERDEQERPNRNRSSLKRVRHTHTGSDDVDTTPEAPAAAASAIHLDITRLAEAFEPVIINCTPASLASLEALCQQAYGRLNEIYLENPECRMKLSLLGLAAIYNNAEAITILCRYGAQVTTSTEVFVWFNAVVSPFHLAISAGAVESVAALCKYAPSGINVPTIAQTASAIPGHTRLDFLADCMNIKENKLLNCAQLLLSVDGIAPTITPKRAIHLLFECCRTGYYQLLLYLLSQQGEIDINYVHPRAGGTLLHLIIKDQRLKTAIKINLINSLVAAGADVHIPPVAGHATATDVDLALLSDETLKGHLESLGMIINF